jgi:Plasmid pRiA4b ORF-3-like protein
LRRAELTAGSSLADLQRIIQIPLGWPDEYQHRFCIRNHYLGAGRPGGLLFFGDPESMTLSQFAFRPNGRFTYEYNFFDAWLLDASFEGERAFDPKRRYPCDPCLHKGPAPPRRRSQGFYSLTRPSNQPQAVLRVRFECRRCRLSNRSCSIRATSRTRGRCCPFRCTRGGRCCCNLCRP